MVFSSRFEFDNNSLPRVNEILARSVNWITHVKQ